MFPITGSSFLSDILQNGMSFYSQIHIDGISVHKELIFPQSLTKN